MLHFEIASKLVKFGKDFTEEDKRKGKIKFYAQRVARSKVGVKYITDAIVQRTALTRGDVTNVLMTLTDLVNGLLREGVAVDLGELGSLSVEANGKYVEARNLVNADTIKKPQIRYTPKKEMRLHAQRVRISVRKDEEDKDKDKPTSGGSDTTGSGGGHSGGSEGIPL